MNVAQTSIAIQDIAWFKSSHSGAEGGQCVEVAATAGAVHVRDSKNLTGPTLTVSPEAWSAFVGLASDRSA